MTWTRLAFVPKDPPVPEPGEDHGQPPAEVQAMTVLGPLAKGLALLMGKQPETVCSPRGFLGVEWSSDRATPLRIGRVLDGSPAAGAGLRAGDAILRIGGKPAADAEAARKALATVQPGDVVELVILREDDGPSRSPSERAFESCLPLIRAEPGRPVALASSPGGSPCSAC
jgi:membrane-associated protease RseP (regulator of RpoE activity)